MVRKKRPIIKLQADYIFPISSPPLKDGLLICENDGTVIDVLPAGDYNPHWDDIRKLSGVIVPGFVNAHMHLDLSHLHKNIQPKTGLPDFIRQVQQKRHETDSEQCQLFMERADWQQYKNGIVAAADMSNSGLSFPVKAVSHLTYYTFIEVVGIQDVDSVLNSALQLRNEAQYTYDLRCSVTPHAPYSVSSDLIKRIGEYCANNHEVLSIHNQETDEENMLFTDKKGKLLEQLRAFGVDLTRWKAPGKRSLQAIVPLLPSTTHSLLVHNTYSNQADINAVIASQKPVYWILIPNANLYVEDTIPDVRLLKNAGQTIAIGTDSYASNVKLSVLEELKTIHAFFPELDLQEILKWGTLNGARALNMHHAFGSLEPGKKPGINRIYPMDVSQLHLLPDTKVEVLRHSG